MNETNLLREAKKAARQGDYSRAGDLCDMAGHPLEAIEFYLQGKHHLLAGQIAARIGEYSQAAGYFSSGGDATQAAEMYLKAGQKKKAVMIYERSGQYLKAAELEEKMMNHTAAAAMYEMAGQTEKAAQIFAQAGDNGKAAELYEKLMTPTRKNSIDSGSFSFDEEKRSSRYARFAGILYMKAGLFSKAAPLLEDAGMFEQAIEAYRKSGESDHAVALLIKLENHAEALKMVEEDPAISLDARLLGELHLRSGNYERAAEVFLSSGLKFKAAECFESSGDLARAASLYAAEGETSRAADLYASIGRHLEAAGCYEKAREFSKAGDEFERARVPDEAVRVYLAANRTIEAARIYLDLGSSSQAIRVLQRVQKSDPDFARASFMLGELFLEQGLYSPAAEKFETALRYTSDEREKLVRLYHLALAHEHLGRVDHARKLYEKILSIDYHHADVADRVRALAAQAGNTSGMRAIGSDSTGQRQHGQSAPPPNISGRLEVIRKLGQGRYATVFEGYDRVLQRKVAVKRYSAASEKPDMVSRFQREAQKAAQLSHPNLVTVLGVGEDREGRYILQELVTGRTLREVLDEKIRLTPARVVEMATQASDLLGYAHRNGILHRDLRPENIFLVGEDQIKISDFGLKARMTDPDAIAGTAVCYLAPEALRSERVDERSDIYSLGVILYELMLGEPPFHADTASFDHLNTQPAFPRKVDRPMPGFLRKLIGRCLEKDRAKRYKNAAQVLDDLKASAIVPGAVIADRYEIVREIGLGGMGRIYQALDRDLDEQVALKVLRISDGDQSPMERFLREVKMARKISHPNVVKVYDLGTWKEHKYITMEYIDGINLEQWVRLRAKLDLEAALELTVDIAGGIASAHALGIIHRDVKPQNILLQDGVVPKILDFGIARSSGGVELTTAGFVMGSPKYMSPEQVQALPLDLRSDIYSLGVLMYFIFTGREPFVGDTPAVIAHKHIGEHPRPPRELNPEIPEWLERVILRAMSKDRDERHASMHDLIAALKAGISSRAAMQGGGEPA